jgi:hypothetical protein
LLDIEFGKRETFAYACEAYSRMLELEKSVAGRKAAAEEYSRESHISDERVNEGEVASILREAAAARNGWKVILERCAPIRRATAIPGSMADAKSGSIPNDGGQR